MPVRATLYWRLSTDPRLGSQTKAEVEIDIYDKDANLSVRIVGDGTTLYRYDIGKGEVTTTQYGFYGEKPPGNHDPRLEAQKLISQVRAVTPGSAAYLARVLAEVNPAGEDSAPRFTSWDPGVPPYSFQEAWDAVPPNATTASGAQKKVPGGGFGDVLRDPLTDATYIRGDRSHWLLYRVDEDAPRQTEAIHAEDVAADGEAPNWWIDAWRINKASPGRFLSLAVSVRAENSPNWAFVPYQGAYGASFKPVTRGR